MLPKRNEVTTRKLVQMRWKIVPTRTLISKPYLRVSNQEASVVKGICAIIAKFNVQMRSTSAQRSIAKLYLNDLRS